MYSTIYFRGTVTTLSPMSHNSDESVGVDTKFRRISIIHNGRQMQIPAYSGNAFRGILRRIAARQFCAGVGLYAPEKKDGSAWWGSVFPISDQLYYAFFTGGSLKKGSAQSHIEIGKKRELRKYIPFLSVFGSAIENQIIQGKLQVDACMPISKETAHLTGVESELSIWGYTDEIFYTRRDALEDKEKKGENDQAQQMKYNIECLVPGVVMRHGVAIKNVNAVELGCLSHAMREIQIVGILGGKSGVGHGHVKMEYSPEWPDDKPYIDYLAENKEEIVACVRDLEARL